ncbi:adherens junction-associated protein 1-like [Microcaecilia unicolor]|uniref:Adherens junction-associated protein 1-like n=1 Tax=Microcaecilia unicolor TaxID=1415580 RepID=A0A6P7ZVY7_9AMPH|nr:adherens junction-associated protein 1-like [Microcaecilia unicolor]XP_030078015.1 adherens junction-associated protein 1-like [Microcaecilia unicolor]
MWIKQLLGISSLSVCRAGHPLGSHAWILIAMFQVAMDFTTCDSVSQGQGFKHLQRPLQRHRSSSSPLWSFRNGQQLRIANPFWNLALHSEKHYHRNKEVRHLKRHHKARDQLGGFLYKNMLSKHYSTAKSMPSVLQGTTSRGGMTYFKRQKRQLLRSAWDDVKYHKSILDRQSQPTTISEFIIWGPTGEEELVESSTSPGNHEITKTSTLKARATTVATTTTSTTTIIATTLQAKGFTTSQIPGINTNKASRGRISTTEPYMGQNNNGKAARPPGDTSGLAVHQIITITVSLIMVIAALITTLVLKNCCAQSGNTRRNSHQRKINQQEESCQNLTDFTTARVPSNMDIFTAYNETLQCSHECVRTPVPVYTDESLSQPGVYKTTFNGNRPSSDRHLIPVAFVSEKWFEISC